MSKIRLVSFKQEHLAKMDLRKWERRAMEYAPDAVQLSAQYFEHNGMGYTAVNEDGIIGAAGLVRVLPGTWEAWCLSTPLFRKYGLQITRLGKRLLDAAFEQPSVHRLQCLVNSRNYMAIRWAEALGFDKESTMKAYGPRGEDFYMYARVKKDN